jgi:hypothetical protein
MRSFWMALALVMGLGLAACQFHATTMQANPELDAEAAVNFNDLVSGRDAAILARMSSVNDPVETRAQLPMLREMLGEGPASEPTVIQTRSSVTNRGRFYEVVQSFSLADRQARVVTTFVSEDGTWKVQGFNVNVTARAQGMQGQEQHSQNDSAGPSAPPEAKAPGGTRT